MSTRRTRTAGQLFGAISRNDVDAARFLLDNKATVSAQDLQVAGWLDSAILPLLVPAAHLDQHSQNAANMLVTLASTRGTTLSVALDYGISVDAIAANGKTALVAHRQCVEPIQRRDP